MDKNALISFFYNISRDLPLNKLSDDSLRHKEFIFNETPQEPIYGSNYNMSQSFINESYSTKPKINNKNNWRSKPERNNAKENNFTKNSQDDTMNFFTNGITANKNEVEAFVKGSKNTEIKSDMKPVLKSNDAEKFRGAFITMDEKEYKTDSMTENSSSVNIGDVSAIDMGNKNYNEFFKNPDVTITNAKESARNLQQENILNNFPNQMSNKVVLIPAFNPSIIPIPIPNIKYEPVKIDNIFLFNQKIKISYEFPLWYLHYPMPQQSITGIGPISSKRLSEMYNMNQVHGNTDFRPVDIFKFTFNNSNEFGKLKMINDDEWIHKIEDSPLLQYTELYSRSQKIFTTEVAKNQISEKLEKNEKIKFEQEIIAIEEKATKKNSSSEEPIQIKPTTHTIPKTLPSKNNFPSTNTNHNETLNFTRPIEKNEISNFVTDTIIEDQEDQEKTLFLKVDVGIKKEVEDEDFGQWEVVKKAKKKQKAQDESVYLIGNKQKDNKKKENKFNCKIDIIPSEELVNQLKPKQKQKEIKPDFEAFNVIGNSNESNKNQNQNQQQFYDPNKIKKKNKGKPQDINVKLGFKI